MLNRNDILKHVNEKKTKIVDVFGGQVIVSVMSGTAKDMFERMCVDNGSVNITNIRAKLVAATCVDEQGNLLFSAKDVEELGKINCADLDKIVAAAQELNVISDKDVNELAKN